MRKTHEEITREVYGRASRWIGWNNWLKHQLVFKYIEKKVEEGSRVGSKKDFYLRDRLPRGRHNLKVVVDKCTGGLEAVWLRNPLYDKTLEITSNKCTYSDEGRYGEGIVIEEMFDDPWRPTIDELDLFQMLYGDDQVLIEMDRDFYGQVMGYNKAAGQGRLTIVHIGDEF